MTAVAGAPAGGERTGGRKEQDMASISPLALAALGLLAERPMHPYEMYQLLLHRQEDRLLKVRPGTLYHTVDRLDRDGLVRALRTERAGNRPERTTFEITDAGRRELSRRLVEMLSVPAEEYPEFPLAISQAYNLPREQVVACLRTRLQVLSGQQKYIGERLGEADLHRVPRLFWLDVERDRVVRDAETAWLERIVEEIESGALPWLDSAEVQQFNHHAASAVGAEEDDPPDGAAVPLARRRPGQRTRKTS
jgi:DNA-binding PadR family transcriptional regulator